MLTRIPARTRIRTIILKRITALTMLLIITCGALTCKFQLIFGIDEKTTEADDLISFRQPAFDRRVELTLNARLNLDRNVLALTLNVDHALRSFLDDGFVRYG